MTISTASQSNAPNETDATKTDATKTKAKPGREPGSVSLTGVGMPVGNSQGVVPAVDQPAVSKSPTTVDPPPPNEQDKILQAVPEGEPDSGSGLARIGLGRQITGGVVPFLDADSRAGLWWAERERVQALRRDGFVALRPAREKRIYRILPRTVIGISTMLLMLGVGAAFSGAAFYAYYDSRLADNERAVARFVDGFDEQFSGATGAIDRMRTETITEIRDEMAPFREYATEANAVVGLPGDVGPSVWLLETLDENGELAIGAAFAVIGHDGGTAMLTSYSLVEASAAEPSPGIDLIKDNRRIPAQLWSWDVDNDVALLVVDEVITPIEIAGDVDQVDAVGTRLFAMSGIGGQGSTASPGVLIDHSSVGLQHTVPVGTMFRGGPLVTSGGKMIGVASLDFKPLGIDGGEVRHAPDMRAVCLVVLECSRIREEVVIEVADEELQAPESAGDAVRQRADVIEETDDIEGDAEVDGNTDDVVDGGDGSDDTADGGSEETEEAE